MEKDLNVIDNLITLLEKLYADFNSKDEEGHPLIWSRDLDSNLKIIKQVESLINLKLRIISKNTTKEKNEDSGIEEIDEQVANLENKLKSKNRG